MEPNQPMQMDLARLIRIPMTKMVAGIEGVVVGSVVRGRWLHLS
jgi:hypothetical protein